MSTTSKKFSPRQNDIRTPAIRSTVMFQWDFKKALQEAIDAVEIAIEGIADVHFTVDSIVGGRNSLKIRIDDHEHGVERIINCEFSYRHSDERYGYIQIDLAMTGYGMKSYKHEIGRFVVTDREVICQRVLKGMVACLKAVG